MKRVLLIVRSLSAMLALCLAACGGGDGESDLRPAVESASTVTVAGDVTFDSVPNKEGVLLYTKTARKPVRGAKVDVVKAGTSTVLATATTDSSGRYNVAVPVNTKVAVRVWARLVRTSGSGRWDVSVRDNTRGNARYSMQTGSFDTGTAKVERDVHAPSGWGGSSYTKTRTAAPFAVLDTLYSAIAKVRSVEASAKFPTLSVYWSPKNVDSDGDPADGDVGCTCFISDPASIYVLGKANTDTDEYDSSVIAHEWGHYYQNAFSRDDSIGGNHGGADDALDRRVAFSEGWGNAWSGIALGTSQYADSLGTDQADGFGDDLSAAPTDTRGWFNESSIQYVLWHLNHKVGFEPIHRAMKGKLKTSVALTSIHSFAASLADASPGSASALKKLLASQDIGTSTTDAFGGGETNDDGVSVALPMYHTGTAGNPPGGLCVSNVAGWANKIGNYAFVRIKSLAAGTHVFKVTGPSDADPAVEVFQGALYKAADASSSKSESIKVAGLAAGDVVLAIHDYNFNYYNFVAESCFTLEVD